MAKGKKKGRKKAKKIEKPEGALTEVDKTFYELTITDLNRKLARLRANNADLEKRNEDLTQELSKVDEDRSDVIVYLKRILQEKTEDIAELKAGVTKLQETQLLDKETCETKTREMESEYKQMSEQLTSEIKLLEGKLNALEEFRVQKEELMKKYEMQEQEMEDQEVRHKRAVYEIERKFIIAKDKLKKDMESRLLQLSTEFHDATEIRIAATTHRVIRENIAINNELDDMLVVHKRLYSENQNMRHKDKTRKQQTQLFCAEKNKALSKVRVQARIIDQLSNQHDSLSKKLEKYKHIESEIHDAKEDLMESQTKVLSLEYKIRILEQNLYSSKCMIANYQANSDYYLAESKRLEEVILEAVGNIKEALKLQKTPKGTDKNILAQKRENLLTHIFKLLLDSKDTKLTKPSLPSVSSVDGIYKKGDLGFVPPERQELRSQLRAIRTMQSQTGTSLEEVFYDGDSKKSFTSAPAESRPSQEFVDDEEESAKSLLFFDENISQEVEEAEEDAHAKHGTVEEEEDEGLQAMALAEAASDIQSAARRRGSSIHSSLKNVRKVSISETKEDEEKK